jgi:hypothetical protein
VHLVDCEEVSLWYAEVESTLTYRREQTKSSLMLQTEAVTLERRPSRLRGSKDEICRSWLTLKFVE